MRIFVLIVTLCFLAAAHEASKYPIKKVVALMMENRAFDHAIGYLHKLNNNITGLTGTESNPWDPADPNSKTFTVTFDAPYLTTYKERQFS